MKQALKIFFLSLISTVSLNASELGIKYGIGGSSDEEARLISLSYSNHWSLEKSALGGAFSWGIGLRLSNFSSDFFIIESDFEERLRSPDFFSGNIFLSSKWKFQWFTLGLNIDFIGYSTSDEVNVVGTSQNVSNEKFNLFLGGKNDKGFLDSEIWIGHSFGQNELRLGLSHTAVEYEGTTNDASQEDRQGFFNLFFLKYTIAF